MGALPDNSVLEIGSVPVTGHTRSFIQFEGLDILPEDGGANVRFVIHDEDKRLTSFTINVPEKRGSTDVMIGEAHQRMCYILRQWFCELDMIRKTYSDKRR